MYKHSRPIPYIKSNIGSYIMCIGMVKTSSRHGNFSNRITPLFQHGEIATVANEAKRNIGFEHGCIEIEAHKYAAEVKSCTKPIQTRIEHESVDERSYGTHKGECQES